MSDQESEAAFVEPFEDSGESYHPSGQSSNDSNTDSDQENIENIARFVENLLGENDTPETQNLGQTREICKRKRKNKKAWKRNVVKAKRNRGEEYVNYKRDTVAAKTFTPVICNCRRKCSDHVNPETQHNIHSQFYEIYWNGQTAWICGTVQITTPKRQRKEEI